MHIIIRSIIYDMILYMTIVIICADIRSIAKCKHACIGVLKL